MILAKLALGAVGTLAFATVYTFREGTIKIDVDEHRPGGSHVHFWVPAAAVPAALHFVPDDKLQEAVDRAREKGYRVASLHPKILSPLPDRTIRDFIRSVQKVIVPECNYSGQLANLLGAKYGLQAIRVNKFGGIPFTAGEILRAIEEVS